MNNGLFANTVDMNKNGTDTVEHAGNFLTELNSLRTQVEELMAIWKGQSATEFYTSYDALANKLENFQQILDDLGIAIGEGATILRNTEEENAHEGANLFVDL